MEDRFRQMLFDFDEAERRSVLELWRVDELYEDANAELLAKLYEDGRIERKEVGIHAESLASYVCMWANTGPNGGLIALGVEDGGTILGCAESYSQKLWIAEKKRRR